MKKIVQNILSQLAQQIIKKYQPQIIGVTGSVGKTSTKEAIFFVLKNYFNTRTNIKNYNTEFGVPLTIIGAPSGGKNIWHWLQVIFKGLKLVIKNDLNYPEILVLEMAADHPGDINYLVKIAPCQISIITAIGPSHLEFFGTLENVIREKEIIISHLQSKNFAILNYDDNLVKALKTKTQAQIISYGTNTNTTISATELNYRNNGQGLECKIINNNISYPAHFKNVLSASQLSTILASLSIAHIFKIKIESAIKILTDFKFPPGRLQILLGIKNTTIIDDTYNSSPKAVKIALETLSHLNTSGRRWAVLGDMLELGSHTENAHQEAGEWIKEFGIDLLVTVGERSLETNRVAETNGLAPEAAVNFATSAGAAKYIQSEIKTGDLILVKGSQGMRMEKVVKEIMAQPERASELLVRQTPDWLKKQ